MSKASKWLKVFDEHDLALISARAQNAFVRGVDMDFAPKQRRFIMTAVALEPNPAKPDAWQRQLSALHFDHVQRVSFVGADLCGTARPEWLELLAIIFVPSKAPHGDVLLYFADEIVVRLEVECLDGAWHERGISWPVKDARDRSRPDMD